MTNGAAAPRHLAERLVACEQPGMIVHRLLDVIFRTLDTIDGLRQKVGQVIGKGEAQPPSSWPTTIETAIETNVSTDAQDAVKASYIEPPTLEVYADRVAANDVDAPKEPAKKAPAKKKAKASASAAKPKKQKEPSTTPVAASRKGSVDRSGKDFDSARARAVASWLVENKRPMLGEGATLDGKKTLARVLWAVAAAEDAGSEQGLTAADTSALLSIAAGLEVFATNVGRAFRDESALFRETVPDGRSKRYTLTKAGRARVAELDV